MERLRLFAQLDAELLRGNQIDAILSACSGLEYDVWLCGWRAVPRVERLYYACHMPRSTCTRRITHGFLHLRNMSARGHRREDTAYENSILNNDVNITTNVI